MVFFYGSIDLIRQALNRAKEAYGTAGVPPAATQELCRSLIDMCRALTEILPELTKDPRARAPSDTQLLKSLTSAVFDRWDRQGRKSYRLRTQVMETAGTADRSPVSWPGHVGTGGFAQAFQPGRLGKRSAGRYGDGVHVGPWSSSRPADGQAAKASR